MKRIFMLIMILIVCDIAYASYKSENNNIIIEISNDITCYQDCFTFINITYKGNVGANFLNNLNVTLDFNNSIEASKFINSFKNYTEGFVNWGLYNYHGEYCRYEEEHYTCDHNISELNKNNFIGLKKGEKQVLMIWGMKRPQDTVKWGFGINGVYIDPIWNGANISSYSDVTTNCSIESPVDIIFDNSRNVLYVASTVDDMITKINYTDIYNPVCINSYTDSVTTGCIDAISDIEFDEERDILYATALGSCDMITTINATTMGYINSTRLDSPTDPYVLALKNKILYVGDVNSVIVYNVTLKNFVLLNSHSNTTGCTDDIEGIAVSNGVLAVGANTDNNLCFINVTNPKVITQMSSYSNTGAGGSQYTTNYPVFLQYSLYNDILYASDDADFHIVSYNLSKMKRSVAPTPFSSFDTNNLVDSRSPHPVLVSNIENETYVFPRMTDSSTPRVFVLNITSNTSLVNINNFESNVFNSTFSLSPAVINGEHYLFIGKDINSLYGPDDITIMKITNGRIVNTQISTNAETTAGETSGARNILRLNNGSLIAVWEEGASNDISCAISGNNGTSWTISTTADGANLQYASASTNGSRIIIVVSQPGANDISYLSSDTGCTGFSGASATDISTSDNSATISTAYNGITNQFVFTAEGADNDWYYFDADTAYASWTQTEISHGTTVTGGVAIAVDTSGEEYAVADENVDTSLELLSSTDGFSSSSSTELDAGAVVDADVTARDDVIAAVSVLAADTNMFIYYSTNGGDTFTAKEQNVSNGKNFKNPVVCIDDSYNYHIIAVDTDNNDLVYYNFSATQGWGGATILANGAGETYAYPSILCSNFPSNNQLNGNVIEYTYAEDTGDNFWYGRYQYRTKTADAEPPSTIPMNCTCYAGENKVFNLSQNCNVTTCTAESIFFTEKGNIYCSGLWSIKRLEFNATNLFLGLNDKCNIVIS